MAAAAGGMLRQASAKSQIAHHEENDNADDDTAFGGNFDFAEAGDNDSTGGGGGGGGVDFTPGVPEELVNFVLDDQFLKQKWRKENTRRIIKWLSTTLGILVASICFSILGGYMFSSMEMFNEIETCKSNRQKYLQGMDKARDAIKAIGSNFQIGRDERLTQYETTLDTFISAFRNSSWKGDECETFQPQWDFLGSTFFCVTVVTSIGYGWIAPATFWGRLVLICYAVIGIPMYLAALANIGSLFSDVTHYTYHNICCCGTCRKTKMDHEHRKQMKQQMIALWRTEANAPNAAFLEALEEDSGGDSSEEDAADEEAESQLVPVGASLLILLSVIFFGASIFSVSENWSFLDATYYSFITVATIGFGDLVPGLVGTNTGKQVAMKYILVWFFIVFGMTILSMCLQMIQQSVAGSVSGMMKTFTEKKKIVDKDGDGIPDEDSDSSTSTDPDTDSDANCDDGFGDRFKSAAYGGPGNWSAYVKPSNPREDPGFIPLSPIGDSISMRGSAMPFVRPAPETFQQQEPARVTSAYEPPSMFKPPSAISRLPSASPSQRLSSGMFRKDEDDDEDDDFKLEPAPRAPSAYSRAPSAAPSERARSSLAREPSSLSREPTTLEREPSSLQREASTLSRQQTTMDRESSDLMREPSAISRRTSAIRRETSSLMHESGALDRLKSATPSQRGGSARPISANRFTLANDDDEEDDGE